MIVVEYRLVYQLIGRLQAAKVYSGGSTVPAAVVIVVKHRACLPVSRLIVGVQARSFGRWVAGVQVQQLSDSGSSTVRASGGFRRQIGTESCYRVGSQAYRRKVLSTGVGRRRISYNSYRVRSCRRYWQFFLYTCGVASVTVPFQPLPPYITLFSRYPPRELPV
jgi:hypothetical protein